MARHSPSVLVQATTNLLLFRSARRFGRYNDPGVLGNLRLEHLPNTVPQQQLDFQPETVAFNWEG
jgi:hypothetical protein